MTDSTTIPDRMSVGPLPAAWSRGATTGHFHVSGVRSERTLCATVRVFEPLGADTQYLLDRLGTRAAGPLGRPQVESLPADLADGVSVLAFDESAEGSLTARIDLVRRAWDRDILVSARGVPVEAVDGLYGAMIELLATVSPIGSDR